MTRATGGGSSAQPGVAASNSLENESGESKHYCRRIIAASVSIAVLGMGAYALYEHLSDKAPESVEFRICKGYKLADGITDAVVEPIYVPKVLSHKGPIRGTFIKQASPKEVPTILWFPGSGAGGDLDYATHQKLFQRTGCNVIALYFSNDGKLDDHEAIEDCCKEARAVYDHIAQKYFREMDPSKLFVMGDTKTSQIVADLATSDNVNLAGLIIMDPEKYHRHPHFLGGAIPGEHWWGKLVPDFILNPFSWKDPNPLRNVQNFEDPTLLISTTDDTVRRNQKMMLASAAKDRIFANIDCEVTCPSQKMNAWTDTIKDFVFKASTGEDIGVKYCEPGGPRCYPDVM